MNSASRQGSEHDGQRVENEMPAPATVTYKPMTTGEGGAVTTNDRAFAEEIRRLRSHGRDERGQMMTLGYNYRMSDIQAALGLSQLERCDEMRDRRQALVALYRELIPDYAPIPAAGCAWHLYPIRIAGAKRDAVKAKLNAQGIMAQLHYPAIHLQPYWQYRFAFKEGMFPQAEAWAAEELSLPLHSKMTAGDVRRVVDALREALC